MGSKGTSVDVAAPVEFDSIVDALGHRKRRQILVGLLDHNPLDYGEVVTGTGASDHNDANIQMVHAHLPKLEERGFVSWDSDTGTVVKGEQWDEIEPMLRLLNNNEERLPDDVF